MNISRCLGRSSVSVARLAQLQSDGTIPATAVSRRGGRAVECAGLENRKAERPREFESHPLRQLTECCHPPTHFHEPRSEPPEDSNAVRPAGRTAQGNKRSSLSGASA